MNFETFILPFLSGLILTSFFTFFIIKIAQKLQIVDKPRDRHQHPKVTPLLGGVAIGVSFILTIGFYFLFFNDIPGDYINNKRLLGLVVGVLFLLIGGILDDKYNLKPKYQFIFPILAILSVVSTGIGVNFITNPFGGVLRIDQIKIHLFTLFGVPAILNLFSDLLTSTWLIGTIYTTKLLDGIDGLVSGITGIGTLVLGFLCLGDIVHQSDTAILCFLISGAYFGFLIFNFNPAKIFLGEAGSTISGFLLGALAIIAGGKIAITLLILSVPIIDALFVIVSRILTGSSPFKGDRRHLHFKLKALGISDRGVVLIMYSITMFWGGVGLLSTTRAKFIASIFALIFTITLIIFVSIKSKKQINQN